MVKRRTFVKSAGAAGILGITGTAGCIGDFGGAAGEDTINFILSPAESEVDIKKQYEPLFNHLEDETGTTVESEVASDYSAVVQAFKSDQADLADGAPAIAIRGDSEGVAEVAGIRIAYGAAQYFSLITTTPDSGIEELADLEGEEIALADNLSTSGSLFPLYMLGQAGLDTGNAPDGDPVDFLVNYSDHSSARETLIDRDEIMAAGTGAFSTASYLPKSEFDGEDEFKEISAEWDNVGSSTDEQELRLLGVSDPIPRAPILVRSNWDSDTRQSAVDALLNAEEGDLIDESADEDQQLWFSGITEGTIDDFAPVKNVANELGLDLEDVE